MGIPDPVAADSRPTIAAAFAGTVGALSGVAASLAFGVAPEPGALLAVAGAWAGCLMAEGIPNARRAWSERRPREDTARDRAFRIAAKHVGALAQGGLLALAWGFFPFFRNEPSVAWLSGALSPGVILVLLAAWLIYVPLCDRIMDDPRDGLYHTGCAVLGRPFDVSEIVAGLRALAVKTFFLPLMLSVAIGNLSWLAANGVGAPFTAGFFAGCTTVVFLLDVTLASTGYLCAFRLFGWHVRAVETTLFGWAVCLACYRPFILLIEDHFLPYRSGPDWTAWAAEGTALYVIWGSAILACQAAFVWTTACFGARFSNLTHRGIIDFGPYRYVKHPAYAAKISAWWLIGLPGFWMSGLAGGLERAVMLVLHTGHYVLRARAEERMLGADPVYRAYRDRIAREGLVARLARLPLRVRRSSGAAG